MVASTLNKILIYPTDTVWGIGNRVEDIGMVKEVHRLKGSDAKKPLSILFTSKEQLKNAILLPDIFSLDQWQTFFSLQTTLLVRKDLLTMNYDSNILGDSPFVGIRYLESPALCALTDDCPITTTSLNMTGDEPIIDIEQARAMYNQHKDQFPLVFVTENGLIPSGESSTILKWEKDIFTIIRRGQNATKVEAFVGL